MMARQAGENWLRPTGPSVIDRAGRSAMLFRPAHVLVVEDHRLVRHVIARALRNAGHLVLEADDATQALDRLDSVHVDAAVLDISLPGDMNGIQLGRAMRRRDPALPLVFISGLTDWEIQDMLPEGPQIRFLRKPFGARTIVEMVGGLIAAREDFGRVQPAG